MKHTRFGFPSYDEHAMTDLAAPASARTIALQFMQDCGVFLESLKAVFPHDKSMQFCVFMHNLVKSNAALAKLSVRDYYEHLSPFFERCERRDATVFQDVKHPLLTQLRLRDKFSAMDDASRAAVWAWVKRLNGVAASHHAAEGRSTEPEEELNPMDVISSMVGGLCGAGAGAGAGTGAGAGVGAGTGVGATTTGSG